MEKLGLENLIGSNQVSRINCTVRSHVDGQTRAVFDLTGTVEDGILTTFGTVSGSSSRYAGTVKDDYDGSISSVCRPIQLGLVQYEVLSTSQEESNTGVFEYKDVMFSIAIIAVLLTILIKGIAITRRGVNVINEETSEYDNVEYYLGHNGKEYWRVKSSARRRY